MEQLEDLFNRAIAPFSFLDVAPVEKALQPVHDFTQNLSDSLGLPVDQVNYLFLFVLAYPLAIVYRFVPGATLKHVYAILFGVLSLIYMIGNGVYHSLFSCTVAYLIMLVLPNRHGRLLCVSWAWGYMISAHIYRQYVDYMGWTMDFSVPQMVITLKLSAYAFNVVDGQFKKEEDLARLSYQWKKSRVVKAPSLLEFYSWIYYWCTILAGPFFELNDYLNFVRNTIPVNPKVQKKPTKIPGEFQQLIWVWARILIIVVGVVFSFDYPASKLYDSEFIASTSLWYRIWFMYICCVCTRSKYYLGWSLSEGAVLTSGFGYNPDKDEWTLIQNVNVIGVEFSQSLTDVVNQWNQGTNHWLRHYVYFRLQPRSTVVSAPGGRRPPPALMPQLMTFVVSAFWHGFYPGYYYFFVLFFFFKTAGSNYLGKFFGSRFYTNSTPQPIMYVYSALCVITTQLSLNYLAMSFIVLAHTYTIQIWQGFHFLGHILCAVVLLLGYAGLLRARRQPATVVIENESAPALNKGAKKVQ